MISPFAASTPERMARLWPALRRWAITRSAGVAAFCATSAARVPSRLASSTTTISNDRPSNASAISPIRAPMAPASSKAGTTMEISGVKLGAPEGSVTAFAIVLSTAQ